MDGKSNLFDWIFNRAIKKISRNWGLYSQKDLESALFIQTLILWVTRIVSQFKRTFFGITDFVVTIRWTLHVFINKLPNDIEKPITNIHVYSWVKYNVIPTSLLCIVCLVLRVEMNKECYPFETMIWILKFDKTFVQFKDKLHRNTERRHHYCHNEHSRNSY